MCEFLQQAVEKLLSTGDRVHKKMKRYYRVFALAEKFVYIKQ